MLWSFRWALLPGELSKLRLHLIFKVIEGRWAGPASSILLLEIWKPVDFAVRFLNSSIEAR